MKNFNYQDETLDINSSSNYYLIMQSDLHGFTYAILDRNFNKYILLKHEVFKERFPSIRDYAEKISGIMSKASILQRQFKGVYYNFLSSKDVVVPSSIGSEDKYKPIYDFSHDMNELDELHKNTMEISGANIDILFTIPNYVAIDLLELHPGVKFVSSVKPFLNKALEVDKKSGDNTSVHVQVCKDFFYICVLEQEKLMLCNSFQYQNVDELVYYILSVYKQVGLDVDKTGLVLSGFIDKEGQEVKLLKQYLGSVLFSKNPDQYMYSYTFKKIPEQYFSNFFIIQACV